MANLNDFKTFFHTKLSRHKQNLLSHKSSIPPKFFTLYQKKLLQYTDPWEKRIAQIRLVGSFKSHYIPL